MATRKRQTKAQKQAAAIEALRKRIADVYSGAAGEEWVEDENWPTAEQLALIVPALEEIFGGDDGAPSFVWQGRNLRNFETPSGLANQLHGLGVRA